MGTLNFSIGSKLNDDWTFDGICEKCQNNKSECKCKKKDNTILKEDKHLLVFKKEKRRGKTVTLIGEFNLPKNDSTATLKTLKRKLGCGGSFKDGWMEFQGELKDKLRALLIEDGFRFKNGH